VIKPLYVVSKNVVFDFGEGIDRQLYKHLHMAVRGNGRFYNPLYFFTSGLASTIELKMGPYSEGENAWSMTYFTYSSGRCKNYYWGAEPDRAGIGLER